MPKAPRLPLINKERKIDKRTGIFIRTIRKDKKLSQDKLASFLGISRQQLHKIETGQNRVSVGRLACIAKILNVDASFLLR